MCELKDEGREEIDIPEEVFFEIAELIDPIDPEELVQNRTFRGVVKLAYERGFLVAITKG